MLKLKIPDNVFVPKSVDVIIGLAPTLIPESSVEDSFNKFQKESRGWGLMILSFKGEKVLSLVLKLLEERKSKQVFFTGDGAAKRMRDRILYCGSKAIHNEDQVYFESNNNDFSSKIESIFRYMYYNHYKSAIVVHPSFYLSFIRIFIEERAEKGRIKLYFINANKAKIL